MKYLVYVILFLVTTSCLDPSETSFEEEPVRDGWDWSETDATVIDTTVEVKKIQYEKADFKSDDETSYWFVYMKERGSSVYWTDIVEQNHSYFSVTEVMRQFERNKGKQFFLIHFIQVSEATYLDYKEYGK